MSRLSNVVSFGAFFLVLATVGYVLARGCENAQSAPVEPIPKVSS